MKITGSNITIMVKDMDVSILFYTSIGLNLMQRWDNNYAMMNTEGITLGIHPISDSVHKETIPGSGTTSIGFFIENIEEAKSILNDNKIDYKYEADGKSGLYIHFTDPDGTILYFVEPKW
jgi:catechol 2,3-dioxygenase-like lactoylglutathione lyase family enzyme